MSKISKTKVIKIALGSLWWAMVAILAFLAINILSAKMQGKVPSVFGYSVVHIVSPSMEDCIPEGSYILIKKCDPKELKEGDIICFYSDDPTIYGFPNTHRIVGDPIVTENGLEFTTKGDNNLANDAVTAKDDRIVGKYVKNLTGVTAIYNGLEGGGLVVILLVMQAALVAIMVVSAIKKSKQTEKEGGNQPQKEEPPSDKK